MFLEPAPGVVDDYCGAVEQQRENRWSGESRPATEYPLEEGRYARHVRHEESEPEGRHEVKCKYPFHTGDGNFECWILNVEWRKRIGIRTVRRFFRPKFKIQNPKFRT